jgi:multisubunit Na+/H+ antiporter MnhB subunit
VQPRMRSVLTALGLLAVLGVAFGLLVRVLGQPDGGEWRGALVLAGSVVLFKTMNRFEATR